jgi:hypothetical protein
MVFGSVSLIVNGNGKLNVIRIRKSKIDSNSLFVSSNDSGGKIRNIKIFRLIGSYFYTLFLVFIMGLKIIIGLGLLLAISGLFVYGFSFL